MSRQLAIWADDHVGADDAVGTDVAAVANHSAVFNPRGWIDTAHSPLFADIASMLKGLRWLARSPRTCPVTYIYAVFRKATGPNDRLPNALVRRGPPND